MNSELCYPQWGFGDTNHTDNPTPDEYGGHIRDCINHVRENAPDSDLDAAMVKVSVDRLPNGHNY